jgi:hypothetical protein
MYIKDQNVTKEVVQLEVVHLEVDHTKCVFCSTLLLFDGLLHIHAFGAVTIISCFGQNTHHALLPAEALPNV